MARPPASQLSDRQAHAINRGIDVGSLKIGYSTGAKPSVYFEQERGWIGDVLNQIDRRNGMEFGKLRGSILDPAPISLDSSPLGFRHGAGRNIYTDRNNAEFLLSDLQENAGVAANVEKPLSPERLYLDDS